MPTLMRSDLRHHFVAIVTIIGGALLLGPGDQAATAQPPSTGNAAAGGTANDGQPGPAAAAPPKTYLRPAPVVETLKAADSNVTKMLQGGGFASPDEQKTFDEFFRRYFFPRWTAPENNASLEKFRTRVSQYQRNSKPGGPHDRLNELALDLMSRVAKANYHPAARANAMLLIGELNAVEGKPDAQPTPLPEAVPIMVTAIDDPAQIDAVRVAAMVGLARHARFGGLATADARTPVVNALLKILQTKEVPADRTAEGQAWMQGQAAEILGQLGSAGTNGAVANALSALVADSSAPFVARCAAARALGQLNYQGAGGVNAVQSATGLAQLAFDACAAEDAKGFSRRRLKDHISAVAVGLSGADNQHGIAQLMADAPSKALATQLQASIQAMLDALDERNDEAATEKLADPRAKLQQLLKKEG